MYRRLSFTARLWTVASTCVSHAQLSGNILVSIRIYEIGIECRRIDFHGGLDNYLLNTPERFRKSIVAERLRKKILAVKGLPPKNPHVERFYIEKVLKPRGRVAWEMVSDVTGQRLDMKTKKEVVPKTPKEGDVIKTIPPPKPVSIEELQRKYLGPR